MQSAMLFSQGNKCFKNKEILDRRIKEARICDSLQVQYDKLILEVIQYSKDIEQTSSLLILEQAKSGNYRKRIDEKNEDLIEIAKKSGSKFWEGFGLASLIAILLKSIL